MLVVGYHTLGLELLETASLVHRDDNLINDLSKKDYLDSYALYQFA